MASPSPILNVLNELLRGCGVEDRKMELFGLLKDIARELAEGRVTEEEIVNDIRELAAAVAAYRQKAGLASDIEDIVNKLMDAIRAERAEMGIEAVRRRLMARRARREVSRERKGLL